MRERLLVILRRAAHRLLLRRVLESSAMTAAAGGLCAAAVELGWWLSAVSPAAGAAICALAVLGGALLWLHPGLRGAIHLDRPQAAIAGAVLILGGAAGAAGAMLGWADAVAPWIASAALVCAGALAGAALACVRGVSVLQAAVYLDIHGRLDERLATAAEAVADKADGVLANQLYAQALDALAITPYRKIPAWKRTRATLGAMALAAALCGAMGSLPSLRAAAEPVVANLADLPAAVGEMGSRKIHLVVAAMRTSAAGKGVGAEVSAALRESARAVARKDPEQVARAMDELAKALETADDATRRRIKAAILAAAGASGGGGDGAKSNGAKTVAGGNGQGDGQTRGGKGVLVYDPAYAAAMKQMGKGAPDAGDDNRVAMDDVWRDSRAKASAALDAGRVPAEYRRIIRKFFATEP